MERLKWVGFLGMEAPDSGEFNHAKEEQDMCALLPSLLSCRFVLFYTNVLTFAADFSFLKYGPYSAILLVL